MSSDVSMIEGPPQSVEASEGRSPTDIFNDASTLLGNMRGILPSEEVTGATEELFEGPQVNRLFHLQFEGDREVVIVQTGEKVKLYKYQPGYATQQIIVSPNGAISNQEVGDQDVKERLKSLREELEPIADPRKL